jgi:hypothetical protein
MMHSLRALKHVENFPNSPVLHDKSGISCRKGSDSEWTSFQDLQNNFSSDPELGVGRELTESELLSALGRQEIRRLSRWYETVAEQALIRESGQAILIR